VIAILVGAGQKELWALRNYRTGGWNNALPQGFWRKYHTVGDLAETIALLLPEKSAIGKSSLYIFLEQLIRIEKRRWILRKKFITPHGRIWTGMKIRFLINWLRRIPDWRFTKNDGQRLAKTVDLEPAVIAHRISGMGPATIYWMNCWVNPVLGGDHSKPLSF